MNEQEIQELRAKFRGELIGPKDAGYDAARKVYNGMIDRRPALVLKCADVADVIAGVNLAREKQLLLAVRGGGHNGPGLGVCDDGLVIDLSRLKGIRVDQHSRSVRVEGGALWGDVDHATHPFGLAVPSGFLSTTGVGGLTLGGGIGYLARQHGLTIDNLLGVDVVLADGRLVSASAEENADLFWAVRGGGGNFGVVTSFLFRGAPVANVYGGPIFWPIEKGPEVLRFWRDFILKAPEDINGWFGYATVPPVPMFPAEHQMKKVAVVTWCYTGDPAKADAVFKPIRQFSPPLMDFCGPIPFPVLQSLFDGLYPTGLQWYWKADFFAELNDKAIELHQKYAERLPSPHSTMHLYPINGAAGTRAEGRHRLQLPRSQVRRGHRRRRPRPREQPAARAVGQGLLAGAPPVLVGRRLRQHDDGRGRGQREGRLSRQLRTPGPGEEEVRPREPVPGEPERQARVTQ